MFFIAATLAVLATAQTPAPAPADDIRQSVQRGLTFLAQQGTAFQQDRKCSGCHHVPMLLWSHREARRRGFSFNAQALGQVEHKALAPYLQNPRVQPKADGTYVEDPKHPGPEMVYLLAAVGSDVAVAADQAAGLERYLRSLIDSQEADGSWALKHWGAPKKAPIFETDEVYTLWALLALRAAVKTAMARDVVDQSRTRALAWLAKTPIGASVQAPSLRLLVQAQLGQAETARPLTQRLLSQQHPDGGWSYATGGASDALATGQALMALSVAGLKVDERAIQQARQFLLKTQQKDGSWKLSNANRTFFGTGWATVGLLHTLPAVAEPSLSK